MTAGNGQPHQSPDHLSGIADFLAGGGEMGALMRSHDWSQTSLGDPAGWPVPLRIIVRLLLNTRHPMYVFWGEDGACLYNDAYRRSIGSERHPGSLGQPARRVWEEIWDVIGPQIDQVMSGGGATWHENHLVPITRDGRREDVYWTYSYSPIDDPARASGVGGVLVICTETTESVGARLRQAFWISLQDSLRHLDDPREAMNAAAELLGNELGVGRCGYGEVDDSGTYFHVETDWTDGSMPSLRGRLRIDDFGAEAVAEFRAGRVVRLDNPASDPRTAEAAQAYDAIGHVRAVVTVPLMKRGRLVAGIFVHQATPRSWTEDEIALVRGVAERIWAAVERVRAENALRASEARHSFLLSLGDRLRPLDDPRAVMLATAEMLGTHLGAGRVGYAEINEDDDLYSVVGDWTEPGMPSLAGHHRLSASGAPLIAELRRGRMLAIEDVRRSPLTAGTEALRAMDAAATGSVLAVPLVKQGRLAAALYLHCRQPCQWSEYEQTLARDVAARTWDAVERARSAAALRNSETELRFVLDAARFGTWRLDPATGAIKASAIGREIFGRDGCAPFSLDDLLDAVCDQDRDRVRGAIAESLATGTDPDIEYRMTTPTGRTRWVNLRGRPAFAADGAPLYLAGVALDVTEQKTLEARRLALVDLGDRIRDLDDPAELAYSAAEIMGRTLNISRAGYGTIDIAAETITIERDWNAPGIRSLAGVLQFRDYGSYIEDLKRGETVVFADAERDPRTADNADALKAISAQSVVNMPVTEQGGLVAMLYLNHAGAREWTEEELDFVREVAERIRTAVERRRAEQDLVDLTVSLERQVKERTAALQASQTRLRTIFETSFQHQGLLGLDGTLLDANATLLEGIGLGLDEVEGRKFWDIPWFSETPGLPDAIREAVAAAARGESARHEIAVEVGSEQRWFDLSIRPMRGEGGRISAIVAEAVETTERRQAEEALLQAQKLEAMGQLTGGVAHDFNNLLTPIVGSLDMLHRKGVGTEREQRLIAGAMQAADRARTLVQRLLAFARRQPLQASAVDVAGLISDMAALVASTTGPQIQVLVDVDGDLPAATADPNQLEMAILNLAVNSRDAMPGGGTLRITARSESIAAGHPSRLEPGAYVVLSVADDGEGMDSATLGRAIEPFFSTKGIGKGTGLGLSMVHGLASQLGGALTIHSEPGVGTDAQLWLPVSVSPARRAVPSEAPATADGTAIGTILLVDDEEVVRASTADMLGELGYQVVEADSGERALALVNDGLAIDVLVTDHLMHGMTGVQLVRAIKRARPEVPALIISGFSEAEGIAPDIPRLSKPFRQADLAGQIFHLTAARPAASSNSGAWVR